MIKVEEVLPILNKHFLRSCCQLSSIENTSTKVLCHSITTPIPHPPFNKAAMDGWAYHSDILQGDISLKLHPEIIKAGDDFQDTIVSDECVRIMTGAKIPDHCNAVHRLEFGIESEGYVHFKQKETSNNIITEGQNLQKEEELLPVKVLNSKDIAVLSASGIKTIQTVISPKIAIVSTGNEIKTLSEPCPDACIYDSNGIYLVNICQELGFDAVFLGIIPDTEEALAEFLDNQITSYDIVIFSGGVSQGDFDLIPQALQKINVTTHIHGVKLKPGKPFYFGTSPNKKAFFGLPGNPLSVFVCFELFVKYYIYKCMGFEYHSKEFQIPLDTDFSRKDSERQEYIPGVLVQGQHGMNVSILPYKGSSMITILPQTEVLVSIPEGIAKLNKGAFVNVRFLQ
ncbi:MAG: molybdopterin molybdotransferase MoeA [Brevinemataceae bacterium]